MKTMTTFAAALLLAVAVPGLAAATDVKSGAKGAPAAQQAAAVGGKVDLNTATEQELAQLAGIGDTRARAIVKGRPYKGKDELVERKIVPPAVYDKIKDQIIAKQAK